MADFPYIQIIPNVSERQASEILRDPSAVPEGYHIMTESEVKELHWEIKPLIPYGEHYWVRKESTELDEILARMERNHDFFYVQTGTSINPEPSLTLAFLDPGRGYLPLIANQPEWETVK